MSGGAGTPPEVGAASAVADGSADRSSSVQDQRERRLQQDRRISHERRRAPAQQRRRRGSPVTREALMECARFLMTRPSYDRVAQYVVTRIMSVHGTRAAVISRFGPGGSLAIIGSFGMPEEACAGYDMLSLWDTSPMSDAAISGEPVILLTPADVAEEYPLGGAQALAALAPIAVWPLRLPRESLGALQLLVPATAAVPALLADGAEVAVLVSLYLSLAEAAGSGTRDPIAAGGRAGSRSEQPAAPGSQGMPEQMTDRQLAILERMAAGHTNAQIARTIGFSESTVRQETMAIYRHLGAGGRQDAARIAAERGLLRRARSGDTEETAGMP